MNDDAPKNALSFIYQLLCTLSLTAVGVYYYPQLKTDLFPYYLVFVLFGMNWFFTLVLFFVGKKLRDQQKLFNFFYFIVLLLFPLVALGKIWYAYGFEEYKWLYPIGVGVITNLLVYFFAATDSFKEGMRKIIAFVFIGLGYALALRMEGIFGGILFGLSFLTGLLGLSDSSHFYKSWMVRLLLFATSVILCRSFIQIYLVKSGYDSLGVVITHSYTFVALCIGMVLPWIFKELWQEKSLHYVELILFFIILPLVLGFFIHVRPVSAFALGLALSTLLCGLFTKVSLFLSLLSPLSLGVLIFGIPYFTEYSNIARITRVWIFLGIVGVGLVYYLLRCFLVKSSREVS